MASAIFKGPRNDYMECFDMFCHSTGRTPVITLWALSWDSESLRGIIISLSISGNSVKKITGRHIGRTARAGCALTELQLAVGQLLLYSST